MRPEVLATMMQTLTANLSPNRIRQATLLIRKVSRAGDHYHRILGGSVGQLQEFEVLRKLQVLRKAQAILKSRRQGIERYAAHSWRFNGHVHSTILGQAYRQLALLLHPDKCNEVGAEEVAVQDFGFVVLLLGVDVRRSKELGRPSLS